MSGYHCFTLGRCADIIPNERPPAASLEAAAACNDLGVELRLAPFGNRSANLHKAFLCHRTAYANRVMTAEDAILRDIGRSKHSKA